MLDSGTEKLVTKLMLKTLKQKIKIKVHVLFFTLTLKLVTKRKLSADFIRYQFIDSIF